MGSHGWIGVDLDGTLAHYEYWKGENHIGAPIPLMVDRVKAWRAAGHAVRIMTARVAGEAQWIGPMGIPEPMPKSEARQHIEAWSLAHLGEVLPVTCVKDYGMIELWDDRAVQVEPNTGRRVDGGA